MATSDRRKVGIAQRNGDSASVQTRLAQPFCRLLAEMAQRGLEKLTVVCVMTESLIVGNRFRFGVDEKFERIDAARFALKRLTPFSKDFFETLKC